ncbi:MAG: membrane fusion protein (multidrug efflux system) [Flavobacteriales bacterium]|jgi:membrane fusion protein (multidrug efflux system)
MKNITLILGITLAISSCATDDSLAGKKDQLSTAKGKLISLMSEVKELEIDIAKLDTSNYEMTPINVQLQTLSFQSFEHFVGVEGIVEAEKDVMVSFQSPGEIIEVNVEEGDKVKKGQILARLNASPLQNQLAELRTRWELANTIFLKQKRLWIDQNIGSEIRYLETKSNKEAMERSMAAIRSQIAMSVIKSPINGIVDKINYKRGAFASPQMPFAQILNLKNLYINAALSESYLPKVKTGDSVLVNFHSLGYEKQVPIYRIGNVINPQNRSFEVQLKIMNEGNMIKPNALASLKIRDYFQENSIVLPSNVVQQDIDGSFVFVALSNGKNWKVEKRYVEVGLNNAKNETLILSGLNLNEKVAVKGYNQLTNNALVAELIDQNTTWK